jgi:hypothetical protein
MGMGPWRCRLKDLFEFAQGLDARESWLGDPGLAAGHDVQHPERHFQNPRCLDVFQAAVRHRPAAFYESGMQPYCPAVPRMPGIADFTQIPNMGVVLLSCTITGAPTRRSAIARRQLCSRTGQSGKGHRHNGGLCPPTPPGFSAVFFQNGWFLLFWFEKLPYTGEA